MTRALALLALTLLALSTGCVQSLHPYYTNAQLTYDPALVGKWAVDEGEGKGTFDISGEAANNVYHVVYTEDDGKMGKFEVHLAKVGEQLLLDISPQEMWRDDQNETHQVHLLPVHSFMLLDKIEPEALHIRQINYDWLKEHLEKNPTAVGHETIGGDRIVLTAPTEKVQAFVLEHVKTPQAYGDPAVLKRVPPAAAVTAPDAKP